MDSAIQIIPVAAAAFVATNLDNFALLVTFLVRFRQRMTAVASAYVLGVGVLGLAAYGIGQAATVAPVAYLGWLGLVPIGLGVYGLVTLFRKPTSNNAARGVTSGSGRAAFLATLLAQLGNGTDTVLTFGALFADSAEGADALVAITLLAMAVLFLVVAKYAVQLQSLAKQVDKFAHYVTPFILIGVGAYIVANTVTDVLPG